MAMYRRILLKLSGEALMGDDAFGINRATIVRMVREVQEVTQQNGSRQSAISHLPNRLHHSIGKTSSASTLAAIAARTDFISRRSLRRFACSWARRLALLSISEKEPRVRR